MAILDHPGWLVLSMTVIAMLLGGNHAIDIYLDWDVALDSTVSPVSTNQPVSNSSQFTSKVCVFFVLMIMRVLDDQ